MSEVRKKTRRDLAQTETVPEVKNLRDKIKAIGEFRKAAGTGREELNDIAEAKIDCEVKGGLMLRDIPPEWGGDRRSADFQDPQSAVPETSYQQALAEAGPRIRITA